MLPILPKAVFTVKNKFLPNKGKLELRPFNVGQEGILLQVKDAESQSEKYTAIKQILNESIVTKDVTIESLPTFMVELLFLRLREKSIGEMVDLEFRCKNKVIVEGKDEKEECGSPITLQIDLRQVDVMEEKGHTNKVLLTDKIGMTFKYPTIENMDENKVEKDLVVDLIDTIFEGDVVHVASEQPRADLMAFYNELEIKQKKSIFDQFLSKMPHIWYSKKQACPKCGIVHEFEFDSLEEIFT